MLRSVTNTATPRTQPPVSVIVPTLDRCSSLMDLLHSLKLQTYHNFEVVVVAGPCTDDTMNCLRTEFGDKIVLRENPERNVSISRNIGASAARGDILAFIDDDEIPEASWLNDLVYPFESSTVGAVGGAVIGQAGRSLDWLYCSADRYGAAFISVDEPTHLAWPDQHDPARRRTVYLPGGNFAVRRTALQQAGGFDESIAYYLDETDFFFRLDADGWEVQQLTSARIHHRVLAGIARDADDERTTNWSLVLRSRAYFAAKHALPLVGAERVLEEFNAFTNDIRATLDTEGQAALDAQADVCRHDITVAAQEAAGFKNSYLKIEETDETIRLYPTTTSCASGHIVIIAKDQHRSARCEGLARSLAGFGHEVRLLRRGQRAHTFWEQGIWIHSILDHTTISEPFGYEDLRRINATRPVDLVVGDRSQTLDMSCARVNPPSRELANEEHFDTPAPVPKRSLLPAVARLSGGAGNQLFQYAAAISLRGQRRAYVIAAPSTTRLSLQDLVPGWPRFVGRRTSATLRRVGAIPSVSEPLSPNTRQWVARRTENQHGTLAKAVAGRSDGKPTPIVLDGYFQHPDWYKPGDQAIVRTLLQNAPPGWDTLRNGARFTVVSVRRGDFVGLGWVLPEAYYEAALMMMDPQQAVVVVSDDPGAGAEMRQQIRSAGRSVLEPGPLSADSSVNDFWLIAAGADVVMSNSTFCWWATRVGDASADPTVPRVVIAPSTWIPNTPCPIIDPSWCVVETPGTT